MTTYPSLTHLPPVRRVVTGHNSYGQAIVHSDESLFPVAASTAHSGTGFTLIHRTEGFPVTNQGSDNELAVENLKRSKHPLGIVCELVDLPPGTTEVKPLLHRNQSLDYGVVLEGKVVLELEEGVEKELGRGDVFVQRGTLHAWRNEGDTVCRFLTVIIPAKPVVIEASGEPLASTKMVGLTE